MVGGVEKAVTSASFAARPAGMAHRSSSRVPSGGGESTEVTLLAPGGGHERSGHPPTSAGCTGPARLRDRGAVLPITRGARPATASGPRQPPPPGRPGRADRRPGRRRARLDAAHLVRHGDAGRPPPHHVVDPPQPPGPYPGRRGLP